MSCPTCGLENTPPNDNPAIKSTAVQPTAEASHIFPNHHKHQLPSLSPKAQPASRRIMDVLHLRPQFMPLSGSFPNGQSPAPKNAFIASASRSAAHPMQCISAHFPRESQHLTHLCDVGRFNFFSQFSIRLKFPHHCLKSRQSFDTARSPLHNTKPTKTLCKAPLPSQPSRRKCHRLFGHIPHET